jgi:hypothetical protein
VKAVIVEAARLWARSRGSPSWGRIGKAMKKLVTEHGQKQVMVVWEGYLNDRSHLEHASPEHFVAHYEFYRKRWGVEYDECGGEVWIPSTPESGRAEKGAA